MIAHECIGAPLGAPVSFGSLASPTGGQWAVRVSPGETLWAYWSVYGHFYGHSHTRAHKSARGTT